jgi:hypothetical protein
MAITAAPRRWALVLTAVIGLGLVAAPFGFKMFDRAPQGATMLMAFKPFMTDQRLAGFQTEIKQIDLAVHETNTAVAAKLGPAATTLHSGDYADFASQWPTIHSTMKDLLDKVQANKSNYDAVAALPSFRLFPWFFVIPGVLLLAFALLALLRPATARWTRAVIAVLGIGLILAPVVFQMFTRAPKGGDMMNAFASIETPHQVSTIQGYFGNMAAGQGALRNEVVPALKATGLTDSQIAEQFPDVAALDTNWIHILNDMTPMIGAMSDSVPHYQAIKALPPFPLFPWFFVIPGVLVAGAVLGVTESRPSPSTPTQGAV